MADTFIYVLPATVDGRVKVPVDEIGKLLHPYYKMEYGAEGSATPVSDTSPLPVGIYGSNGNLAYVDQYSGAVGAIEQEHLQIHQGNGYTFAERLTIANVGGTHDFLIIVPDGTFPHLRNILITSDGGPADVDLYEGATVSDNGTQKTPLNNNRNSSNTPATEVYNSPTVTDTGTLLEPILLTGTKQSGSFGSDGANEWILKTNSNILLRVTNNTVGAGTSSFIVNLFWYE